MAIRRGLRTWDDDDNVPQIKQKTHFEANRHRGNMEKDIDNLFWGGGQPKKVDRQNADEQKKKKQHQQKQRKQAQARQDLLRQSQTKQPKPAPKLNNFTGTGSPSAKPVNQSSPVKAKSPRREHTHQSQDQQQQITIDIPKQPQQYNVIDMGDPYRMPLQIKHVHNKPVYVRKFKKVAENFNFAHQNTYKHRTVDVVRPKECNRDKVSQVWAPEFIDSEFPPNERAMGKELKGLVSQWKRISDVCNNVCLGKYIDPNDIVAGRFSSPQFLSTLCCLSEKEENIKRIIEDQSVNSDGFYFARINQNGVWRYFVVDDFIPMLGKVPALASSHLDQETDLWVSLVQKAYAKAFLQGYTLFKKVQSHQIYLRDLTGAPCQVHPMNNPETIHFVKDAIDRGYSVIAVGNQQALHVGLNPNYAFNVLKCDVKAGLEMRNSWGSIEERSKLNASKEGTFNMTLQQCREFLNHIIIGRINDQYHSSVIQSKHRPGFCGSYTFTITNEVQGILSVSQLDQRMLPPGSGYSYSPIRIILEKNVQGRSVYINSIYGQKFRNIDLDVALDAGQYTVHVVANWNQKEYDYFVSFYGSETLFFKRQYTKHLPNAVGLSLSNLAIQDGRKSTKGTVNQYVFHHPQSNLVIITAENSGDRSSDHNCNLSNVQWKNLTLVSGKSQDQTFHQSSRSSVEQQKNQANKNRRWTIRLEAKQVFTWVIASNVPYKSQNLDKWGFK